MTEPINHLFAFVSAEPDGKEKIITAKANDMLFPLITAQASAVDGMKRMAKAAVRHDGRHVKLVKFSVREDIETI